MTMHPGPIDQFGQRQRDDEFDRDMHFGDRGEVPANIPAEQALLGAILMNNEAFHAIASVLEPQHFYEKVHRSIYEACASLIGKGKLANTVTVHSRLDGGFTIEGLTAAQYLARLLTNAVTIVNAPDYAAAILFAAERRNGMSVGVQIESVSRQCAEELTWLEQIQAFHDRLGDIITSVRGETFGGKSFADAVDAAVAETARAHQHQDVAGIDCGVPVIKRLVGPLTAGQLIIIGGGTKQGKTALAGQICRGATGNGYPVYMFSGEIGAQDITRRELARDTGIGVAAQKEGDVSESDYASLEIAKTHLKKLRWKIQDEPRTLDQLESEITDFVKRNGFSLVCVDAVTLVDRDKDNRRASSWEFAEIVTARLKRIARKVGCPILALSQLKKNTFVMESNYGKRVDAAAYRKLVSRRPRYSDILGACERDADHVIIPFRPEPILEEAKPSENSDEFVIWEEVMRDYVNQADVILALSRERKWPRRIDATWDGLRSSFNLKSDNGQRGFF